MTFLRSIRSRGMLFFILTVFWLFMLFIYLVPPENRTVARRYGGMREKEITLLGGDTVVQDFEFPFDGLRSMTVFLSGRALGGQEISVTIEDMTDGALLISDTLNSAKLAVGQREEYDLPSAPSAGHVLRLTVINNAPAGEDAGVYLTGSETVRAFEKNARVNDREQPFTLASRLNFCDAHVNRMYFAMWALFIAGSYLCLLLLGEDHARNFLAIGFLCGLVYVFWNPYPQPIDEPAHFFRANAIASGHINAQFSSDVGNAPEVAVDNGPVTESSDGMDGKGSDAAEVAAENRPVTESSDAVDGKGSIGAEVPANYGLYDSIWVSPINTYANDELLGETISDTQVFFEQPYAANYIPINYLPAAFGVAAARLLGLGIAWPVYFARLMNLFIYLGFGYFAIRKTRVYRAATFAAACLPLPLYFAGSVSIDVALNGAAVYFTATCVKYAFSDSESEKIGIAEMVRIVFSALFIASPKFLFYTPLFLLLFFIPKEKYVRRSYQFILFGIGLLLVAGMLAWQLFLMRTYVFEEDRNGNVSMAGQLAFMKENPKTALRVLVTAFVEGLRNYYGTYTMYAPNVLKDIATAVPLAVCILSDREVPEGRVRVGRAFAFAGCLIAFFVGALTIAAAYIGYTPVGELTVEGVQPRYMLPVLPLLFIALSNVPARYYGRNFAAGSAFALLLVNAATASYTALNFRAFP